MTALDDTFRLASALRVVTESIGPGELALDGAH
jgi:hypothetical protein